MTGKRIVGRLAGIALATIMLASVPAAAHERGFVAFGLTPLVAPPVYYPPPPVIYAPPPVVYAPPPPVYVYPAPVVAYPAYPAYPPAYGSISLGFGFSGHRR
jgi:hypothetical protein